MTYGLGYRLDAGINSTWPRPTCPAPTSTTRTPPNMGSKPLGWSQRPNYPESVTPFFVASRPNSASSNTSAPTYAGVVTTGSALPTFVPLATSRVRSRSVGPATNDNVSDRSDVRHSDHASDCSSDRADARHSNHASDQVSVRPSDQVSVRADVRHSDHSSDQASDRSSVRVAASGSKANYSFNGGNDKANERVEPVRSREEPLRTPIVTSSASPSLTEPSPVSYESDCDFATLERTINDVLEDTRRSDDSEKLSSAPATTNLTTASPTPTASPTTTPTPLQSLLPAATPTAMPTTSPTPTATPTPAFRQCPPHLLPSRLCQSTRFKWRRYLWQFSHSIRRSRRFSRETSNKRVWAHSKRALLRQDCPRNTWVDYSSSLASHVRENKGIFARMPISINGQFGLAVLPQVWPLVEADVLFNQLLDDILVCCHQEKMLTLENVHQRSLLSSHLLDSIPHSSRFSASIALAEFYLAACDCKFIPRSYWTGREENGDMRAVSYLGRNICSSTNSPLTNDSTAAPEDSEYLVGLDVTSELVSIMQSICMASYSEIKSRQSFSSTVHEIDWTTLHRSDTFAHLVTVANVVDYAYKDLSLPINNHLGRKYQDLATPRVFGTFLQVEFPKLAKDLVLLKGYSLLQNSENVALSMLCIIRQFLAKFVESEEQRLTKVLSFTALEKELVFQPLENLTPEQQQSRQVLLRTHKTLRGTCIANHRHTMLVLLDRLANFYLVFALQEDPLLRLESVLKHEHVVNQALITKGGRNFDPFCRRWAWMLPTFRFIARKRSSTAQRSTSSHQVRSSDDSTQVA
ncbi:Oidioi.mRNA.OKI2018_I69.YSR.g17141.t1.cds [Oikopleura dioica]|uniref:Oidioi.mRNA.OKI2018_I69.YSR.g17141.t1.cds n=1 Tax=Oikopleura dioica TaxID=34765 RepID=A0ABN7SIA5_OIKDI|nr:Oidioi.mRNA.OKI2018_I69.YSR.g17141.t1.cds [Oikopleura dioica]